MAGHDVLHVIPPTLHQRGAGQFIEAVGVFVSEHGERAVVAIDEIEENLALYEKAASTDRAGFNKRIHASVEKIKKHNILQKIRASDDRYEISPTLKLLFSAEEIATLTLLYQRMAAGDLGQQPDGSEDDAASGENA